MAERKIPHMGRIATRVLWVMIVLSALALWGAGISARFQELQIPCNALVCPFLSLTAGEIDLIKGIGFSIRTYADIQIGLEVVSVLTYVIPGLLIFWRRSQDRIGYLFSLALILIGTSAVVNADDALLRVFPSFSIYHGLLVILSTALIHILFIFPDGDFVPNWSRYYTIFGVTLLLIFFIQTGARSNYSYTPGLWQWVGNAYVVSSLLLGALAQMYRFRNISGPTERQQTKWVVFGVASMVAGITTWILVIEIFPLSPGVGRIFVNLLLVAMVSFFNWVFPITVSLAILRYRLWDIDILIRRTLQYTLLTAILALVYFGSVILLQSLVENLTGEQSPLVIVLSTLAIAALFNPLRHRVQDFIDKRFYRSRYNAEHTLLRFAAMTRNEVDLYRLSSTVVEVVEETLQPERLSLWIRRKT
jgi:hypothetical protein